TAHGGAGTVLTHANGVDVSGSPFAITQGTLTVADGNGGANYSITYTGANLTLAAKALAVTADNASRLYDHQNPAFTGTISGFVTGENASVLTSQPVYSTAATLASPAGFYPITASGALAANYSFTYVGGLLDVSGGALPSTVLETIAHDAGILFPNTQPESMNTHIFIDPLLQHDLDLPPYI
ncbi:MAG: hypothetical protein KGI29_06770, partial [Pseudomonadota bacterium]|nr:hypothetical protein [Pseudomonadota bacterium]